MTVPKWAPYILSRCEDQIPEKHRVIFTRLTSDPRMKEVWKWHKSASRKFDLEKALFAVHHIDYAGEEWLKPLFFESLEKMATENKKDFQSITSLFFLADAFKASKMPGKPADMPPKARQAYLKKVQKHCQELKMLLEDTEFDKPSDYRAEQVPQGEEPTLQDLYFFRAAGRNRSGGVYKKPRDYPDCDLTTILERAEQWTDSQDTNTPIRQMSPRARIIYFICTLYERHLHNSVGLSLPPKILATTANVALQLPDAESVDEDAARKQIRRHMKKRAET